MLKYFERLREQPSKLFVLGFAAVILLGALLLTLPFATRSNISTSFVDALFTATSAVCVTGLVVQDTATYWSTFGQVVIITLIQIGGLGIMTMASLVSLLIGRKISLSSRLLIQESLGTLSLAGVVRLTRYVVLMTFLIESIGAWLLSYKFIPLYGFKKGIYMSVFHSISAFCNAGFDLMGDFRSLTGFVEDPLVNLVIMGLIIFGGLGFSVVLDVAGTRKFSKLSLHTKMVVTTTGVLILGGFLMTLLFEWGNPQTLAPLSFQGKVLSAMFNSVTPRTAGFNTLSLSDLTNSTLMLVMVLMFIGGSPGSTAGGIKTTTMALIFMTIISITRGKEDTEIFKRRVSREAVNRSLAILGIAITCVTLVMIVLNFTEPGASFMEIMFETFSAMGTVGLSLGITPSLSTAGKLVVAATMFVGRLGVLTIAFAITRKQKSNNCSIKYPEEKVNVG